jgi:hypothetical protein
LFIIDHHGGYQPSSYRYPDADPHSALDDSTERDWRWRNYIGRGCRNMGRTEPVDAMGRK